MFRETTYGDRSFNPEQLEHMNGALFNLITYSRNVEKLKRYILEVKTTFFQPYQEIIDLVKQKIDNEYGARPYGWGRYKTLKEIIRYRKTHQYRDGFSYLDEFEDAGRVEELSSEMHRDYESADETTQAIYTFRILSCEDGGDGIEGAFYNHFGGSSCTHDYDCCGCWHYSVSNVERIYLGSITLFRVEVRGSRNY